MFLKYALFPGLSLLASTPALAYIGPGLGAGTIGVILGVIGSIFLALFAIFWYPIKRMFKKKEKPAADEAENPETIQATAESSEDESPR